MNIFRNFGERENYGGNAVEGAARQLATWRYGDYIQRLTWLYGDPDARIEDNAPDLAKWRALGQP